MSRLVIERNILGNDRERPGEEKQRGRGMKERVTMSERGGGGGDTLKG